MTEQARLQAPDDDMHRDTPLRIATLGLAGELVAWLKKEFDLGHGHSMAIWAVFKDNGWVASPKKKK